MKTIWKFPFEIEDNITIDMPFEAQILCIQTQNETPQIWALVEESNSIVPRHFEIFGTGQQITDGKRIYIETFQMYSGSLVFHLFEKL